MKEEPLRSWGRLSPSECPARHRLGTEPSPRFTGPLSHTASGQCYPQKCNQSGPRRARLAAAWGRQRGRGIPAHTESPPPRRHPQAQLSSGLRAASSQGVSLRLPADVPTHWQTCISKGRRWWPLPWVCGLAGPWWQRRFACPQSGRGSGGPLVSARSHADQQFPII